MDTAAPPEPQVIALYTADPHTSAMPVVRLLAPARQAGLRVIFGNQGPEIDPGKVAEADVVVIQRDFPRFAGAYTAVVAQAQARKIPVVYETDDLLLALPAEHPSRKDLSDVLLPVLWAVVEADLVTTSTPFLRDSLLPFNPNTHLLPNYLDDEIWSLPDLTQSEAAAGPVCIGYMGGQSHLPDLEWIQPALEAILSAYGERVRLKFWGVRPPEALLQHAEVEWTPLDIQDYAAFAHYFSQQNCDIWIAPLQENPFNRAKSAIKFLEYSALGAPGVYSPIPAYSAIIADGRNGFLAADLPAWQSILARLIENPLLRREIGAAAQQTVKERWLVSQHTGQWVRAYQQAIQIAQSPRPHRMERLELIARASSQIQSRHYELQAENQNLRSDLAATASLAGHLQAQLDEIHHSRSWRLLQKLQQMRLRLVPPDSLGEAILKKLRLLSRNS